MIWRALTHNLLLKLASLMLSVLLWFAIVGEPELVTTRMVPILYRNLRKELMIGVDSLDGVRVVLRGSTSKLTSAAVSDLAVVLDLASVNGPGERTFTVSDDDLHLPPGVTFLRAMPSQFRFHFARLKTKDVPLQVRFAAPPPGGYRVVREEVIPETLRIAGPERRVDATASAQTDAIDLSAATQSAEFQVNTFVDDPQVRLVSPPMVTVKVTIEKSGKNN